MSLTEENDDDNDDRTPPSSPLPSPRKSRSSFTTFFCRKGLCRHVQWKILLFGQAIAFLLACTGAAQSTLAFECQLSAPSFTVSLFYFGLAFCLLPIYLNNSNKSTVETSDNDNDPTDRPTRMFLGLVPIQGPIGVYFGMAVFDVYANYFTVLAFKYTTITSVTLFDALAIPSAMVLSRIFLHRQYSAIHLLGVLCCMIGILVNVLQDYEDQEEEKNGGAATPEVYPRRLLGDTLAIVAGLLFGANNVLAEHSVRTMGGPFEYLGMLGFFAFFISMTQALLFERDEIAQLFGDESEKCSQSDTIWLLLGYWVSSVFSYLGGAYFLQVSEATLFNLSLLTGDLWSVGFSILAEKLVPHPLFYVALVFIISGVVVYEMAPSPVLEDRRKRNDDESSFTDPIHPDGGPGPNGEEDGVDNGSLQLTPQRPGSYVV